VPAKLAGLLHPQSTLAPANSRNVRRDKNPDESPEESNIFPSPLLGTEHRSTRQEEAHENFASNAGVLYAIPIGM
jgi:hypothetical protein